MSGSSTGGDDTTSGITPMTITLDGSATEMGTEMASGSTGLDDTTSDDTTADDTTADDTSSDDTTTGEPMDPGRADGAFVNAGTQAVSPGYRLLWTFGQSSQNQGTMTSPSYRLRGGLVPATQ